MFRRATSTSSPPLWSFKSSPRYPWANTSKPPSPHPTDSYSCGRIRIFIASGSGCGSKIKEKDREAVKPSREIGTDLKIIPRISNEKRSRRSVPGNSNYG